MSQKRRPYVPSADELERREGGQPARRIRGATNEPRVTWTRRLKLRMGVGEQRSESASDDRATGTNDPESYKKTHAEPLRKLDIPDDVRTAYVRSRHTEEQPQHDTSGRNEHLQDPGPSQSPAATDESTDAQPLDTSTAEADLIGSQGLNGSDDPTGDSPSVSPESQQSVNADDTNLIQTLVPRWFRLDSSSESGPLDQISASQGEEEVIPVALAQMSDDAGRLTPRPALVALSEGNLVLVVRKQAEWRVVRVPFAKVDQLEIANDGLRVSLQSGANLVHLTNFAVPDWAWELYTQLDRLVTTES